MYVYVPIGTVYIYTVIRIDVYLSSVYNYLIHKYSA